MSRSLVSHLVANGSGQSSVSPVPRCMICERESDRLYVAYSRPTIGAQSPFFPVLEPLSGSSSAINCCQLCSQSLLNQWNEYESKQIPIKNRIYYLNNKNPIFNKSALIVNHKGNANAPEEVLDLSCTSTTSNSNRTSARGDNNVKHWPNQTVVICYLCGEECQPPVSVLVRRTANCPYFPSLASHPKPVGANPVDVNGRIDSCESCHRFLIQQWDHFQRLSVPISERQYTLRANGRNTDRIRANRYSCVLCNTELSQSTQNVVISMLTLNEANNEIKKLILSSAQEFIIGSGNSLESGRVLTCISCFRDLINKNNSVPQMPQNSSVPTDLKKNSALTEQLCPLCHRIRSQLFQIETIPSPERKPFFPFLKDLVKPHEMDPLGRVKICNMCLPSLESQWEAFESALIPQKQRDYMLSSRSSPVARPLSPPALKIVVSSPPPPLQQSIVCEPLLTTVTTLTTQSHANYSMTNSSKQYLNKSDTKIASPMDEMLSVLNGPLLKATNCLVCGEFSMSGHTYQLLSSPRVPPLINHDLGIYPFFPFLKKIIAINPSNNDEMDVENRSNNGLVCTFCFHSLIGQWIAYNSSPFIEDKDPMRRTYNCRDFICFICGVTTLRQRVRSIELKDFPFLLEHSRPPGALTLSNGESVVTCLTCFDSLTLQWKDYERMKVPIEMRKYNWITVTPPDRDDTPLSLVLKMSDNTSPPSVISTPLLAKGITAGNTMNIGSTVGSTNKNSSFSDALRKLAKQSFDNNEPQNSLLGSTSHQKIGFQSPTMRPSPPIVTIAPIAAHQSIDRSSELRKVDNHSLYEHRMGSDSAKDAVIYSHTQRTSPIVQVRPSPSRVGHNECLSSGGSHPALQQSLSNRSSGFQPYRSGFEESPSSGLPSTGAPLPSHLLPYDTLAFPYHPFLSHSASIAGSGHLSNAGPHPGASYRLPDNYYLDRFGLLRGSMHSGLVAGAASVATVGSNGSTSTPSVPSVPFNLVRYSELMNSQTERLINDERHRLLNQTLSQNSYKPSAQSIDSPAIAVHHHLGSTNGPNISNISNISNNRVERLIETNGEPPLHINHSSKHDFSVNHLNHLSSGSILSGTPIGSSALVNLGRKHNIANISAVKPLNLSSNSEQMNLTVNCSSEQIWRPQSDDQKEPTNCVNNNISHQFESHSEGYGLNRRNSGQIGQIGQCLRETDDCLDSFKANKSLRVNINNGSECGANIADTIGSSETHKSSLLSSQYNTDEGLHSRILDNHVDKNVNNLASNCGRRRQIEVHNRQINDQQKSSEVNNDRVDRAERVNIISKLDLQEIKLKERRVNKYLDDMLSSEEESDLSDSDEHEDKYRIILSKRMPLELDTSEDKMQFLGIFNLTTHKRKSQLEFNKFVKRSKILIEPIDTSLYSRCMDEQKENPDSILMASHISPDSVNSEEKKPEVKVHFMSTLGLCRQNSAEKKRNIELLWTGISKERLLRNKRYKCWSKVLNNLDEYTLHRWLISLEYECQTSVNYSCNGSIDSIDSIDSINSIGSNGFISGNNFNSRTTINCYNNSSRQRKVLFNNKQATDMKSGSNGSSGGSHPTVTRRSGIHSNKDFAQEFHESVLLETTKQQQSRQVVSDQQNKCSAEPTKQQHNTNHSHYQQHLHQLTSADLSPSSSGYKWPGIESVMEAYERYSYDRNQEKEFLHERSQYLKNKLQDINREAEYLSQKMTNMMQAKSHLDEERQRYQTTLDALKNCLRQMSQLSVQSMTNDG